MKLFLLSTLALLIGQNHAFTSLVSPMIRSTTSALAVTAIETDNYFRAIECAEGSKCSMEEMERLAADLENVEGCKFEDDGEELCDREIQDRLDVAQVLRLRMELQMRLDYLKKENLFASDVQKRHDQDERRRFKEMLQANRDKVNDGSDLGLW